MHTPTVCTTRFSFYSENRSFHHVHRSQCPFLRRTVFSPLSPSPLPFPSSGLVWCCCPPSFFATVPPFFLLCKHPDYHTITILHCSHHFLVNPIPTCLVRSTTPIFFSEGNMKISLKTSAGCDNCRCCSGVHSDSWPSELGLDSSVGPLMGHVWGWMYMVLSEQCMDPNVLCLSMKMTYP